MAVDGVALRVESTISALATVTAAWVASAICVAMFICLCIPSRHWGAPALEELQTALIAATFDPRMGRRERNLTI